LKKEFLHALHTNWSSYEVICPIFARRHTSWRTYLHATTNQNKTEIDVHWHYFANITDNRNRWLLLFARRLVAPYKLYRKLLFFCTRSALKITGQLLADSQQVHYEGILVAPTWNAISASNQPRRTVPENKITTVNLSSQLGGCLLMVRTGLVPSMLVLVGISLSREVLQRTDTCGGSIK
jgi:hypothetical protein